jgi:hypothetical protein
MIIAKTIKKTIDIASVKRYLLGIGKECDTVVVEKFLEAIAASSITSEE